MKNFLVVGCIGIITMLCPTFSPCKARDGSVVVDSRPQIPAAHKRSLRKTETPVLFQKRKKQEGEFAIPKASEVFERIQHKAHRLKPQMERASDVLRTIGAKLAERTKTIKETNFKRATELAGLTVGVEGILDSTLGILQRLKGPRDPYTGVAIMASGALKDEFNQLIELLDKSEDTRDIDCTVLREISETIYGVTKDIENFTLIEKDN